MRLNKQKPPSRGVKAASLAQVLLLFLLATGCGGTPENTEYQEPSPAEKSIKVVAKANEEYKRAHGMKPAADIEQLQKWVKKLPAEKQKDLGITDPEKALISPRDNQPYVLVQLPMGMGPVLAYEKTGEDGKKLMVNSVGTVKEMTEEELQKALQAIPKGMPAKYGASR